MPDNKTVARQLALPFDEPDQFAASDFIEAPSNRAARVAFAAPSTWVNGRLVLWGDAGCGKSHLSRLWGAEREAEIVEASQLRQALSSSRAAIVIEDIDAMAAPVALFATLERASASRQPVLMTSRTPPARLAIDLADLASRLRASLTIQIEPAEPALLDAMLVRLAAARQMTISASVQQFLLGRLPRRPAVLREAIARLDRYALALGTAPSRRIAERLLGELADPPEEEQSIPQSGRTAEFHETETPSLL
ncbi:MAG: DNA replication protein [Acidiphilium sp. 37-64-53]|uniref:DnaA ATPase domain-containing protein n=1 Tax=Acidiphilium TaxID=522 RepID=UPI000BD97949|nr:MULTISPECIES: DnaA/Hda family protein [Acidiphilium]OYW02269.1 MAG: DNA replication protein [Acidiphilium sp. 37-64-53]OZB29111.1 MAG: DNA replication protein [Acidiphilium sp. 34-64-41]HQT85538.1 DnaA/Hda family protein [Acidiphilium rubrum]